MRGERARVADRVRELLGMRGVESEPPVRRGLQFRWDPGHRGAAAVGVLVVMAVVVAVWWFTASSPQAVPVSGTLPQTLSTSASPSMSSSISPSGGSTSLPAAAPPASASAALSPAVLVVDVAGKVRHPGVYRLRPGARVFDALAAAGGARTGVSLVSLNLAAPVTDGQQIVVGVAPTAAAGGATATGSAQAGSTPAGSSAPAGPVDLNTATLEQLDALPGVGPVLAQHILDWRTQHVRFTSINQLNDVSGIGDVKFAELRGLVTV